jgi:diguanylate cyclase (GGDEF)-like protein/PAS domain S-box-containing protein
VASATDSFVLTVSPVAPQAITAKPSGQRVSPKAKVTITFSEAMNPDTLTPSTFTLKKGKQNVPAKVTYNEVTRTVTLTPTKKLSSGARYTAIMLGGPLGAKDIGGICWRSRSSGSSKSGRREVIPVGKRAIKNPGTTSNGADANGAKRSVEEPGARYRALIEHTPAGAYIDAVDEVSSSLYISAQVETMLGYAPEEWLVDREFFLKILHPDDQERVLVENARTNESGERFDMEYRLISRDGRTVWVHDEAVLVRDEEGDPLYWQGVMTDVTERKALEERLRHQALHDPLTDLPNRTLLLDRLEHALERAERRKKVAVLFLDLDNFKRVNDSLGHQTGDRLLVEVARRLRSSLRTEDTVARLGGDEFVILGEDLNGDEDAAAFAGRIARALRPGVALDGHEVFVTVSIGIALGSSGEDRPEALLRDAEIAMYQGKQGGKNRYEFYRPVMGELSSQRLTLEQALRCALERGEFVVHYQPKVNIGTGEIVGVEALLRWKHPERGLLPPADFVPLAEETGLIMPLGRWVLEEACRQVKEWHKLYPSDQPLAVNVNLSARQFYGPDLVRKVAGVLRETDLEASSLVLEITEGSAMEDAPSTMATLGALRGLGVKLAIDDFGNGYSSLSYLKRFPLDVIKIDRSIVEGLGRDRGDSAIVSATITLAHALGLEVIAEGMETGEAVAELQALGCNFGQGDYWWRPQPAEKTAALLEATSVRNLRLK